MRKNVIVACASAGVLALSAANMPPAIQSDLSAASSRFTDTIMESTLGRERSHPAVDTSGTHYKLLRAVYGGAEEETPDPSAVFPPVDEATLWLARAIYSETKLPHEQELVAWVIRNRVETHYRGQSTYRGVVLDPYQFSAFNPGAPRRSFYATLTPQTQLPAWQQALRIAHFVRHADPAYRPFSIRTRHFFSEIAMPNKGFPYWVEHHRFVSPGWSYTVDAQRFRFYESIS